MAAPRVREKWRPPLSWIVFAVLLAVLALPTAVVIWFRALDGMASQIGPIEVIALGVALVLTLVIGAVLSRTITGPIDALIARTEEIGRGGRTAITAPEAHGTRELAVLSQSFLDLAQRLVERTDYVNSFAAHVSHELKSPLTSIRGSAELLLEAEMSVEDRKRFLAHIVADVDRLAALLERLRDLARADVPLDAKGVTLQQAADALQLKHPGLTIACSGDTTTLVALSLEAFAIVLGHLASNAAEHGATRLALSATRHGTMMRIVAADDGQGIS
ncbi:MAG TPA: histidine kinase dimerization/phospho-acceptor domain-containing protein, partial [Devosia sp.]